MDGINTTGGEEWKLLAKSLKNLFRATRLASNNLAEFEIINDGEIVDLLEKALDQTNDCLSAALGVPAARDAADIVRQLTVRAEELERSQHAYGDAVLLREAIAALTARGSS